MAFPWLALWLVQKACAYASTNQTQTWKQLLRAPSHFPALLRLGLFLLRVFIAVKALILALRTSFSRIIWFSWNKWLCPASWGQVLKKKSVFPEILTYCSRINGLRVPFQNLLWTDNITSSTDKCRGMNRKNISR